MKYYYELGIIDTYISEKDEGIYDAMNKGWKVARGKWVSYLNSDDVYIAKGLSNMITFLKRTDCDICYGNILIVSRRNTNVIIRILEPGDFNFKKIKRGWHPPHPSFFAKKKLFHKFGGFDLSYKIAADYELMIRFLLNSKKILYLNDFIVKMRFGGMSTKNLLNIFRSNVEAYKALKKNGFKVSPLFIIRKPISKIKEFTSSRRKIIDV